MNPRFKSILPLALLLLAAPSRAQEGLNLYYGLLHAHTSFCDGSGTPEQAYRKARTAGLDFFAVTPHNHAEAENGSPTRDGLLIATDNALYNGTACSIWISTTTARAWPRCARAPL